MQSCNLQCCEATRENANLVRCCAIETYDSGNIPAQGMQGESCRLSAAARADTDAAHPKLPGTALSKTPPGTGSFLRSPRSRKHRAWSPSPRWGFRQSRSELENHAARSRDHDTYSTEKTGRHGCHLCRRGQLGWIRCDLQLGRAQGFSADFVGGADSLGSGCTWCIGGAAFGFRQSGPGDSVRKRSNRNLAPRNCRSNCKTCRPSAMICLTYRRPTNFTLAFRREPPRGPDHLDTRFICSGADPCNAAIRLH